MIQLELQRRKRGISLTSLSRQTGIDVATLSKLEHCKCYPWPGWKRRLADALDWRDKPEALFEDVDV